MKADRDATFDFDGALALARRLYALADSVASAGARRRELAGVAQRSFRGPHADQFARRMSREQDGFSSVPAGLRCDAEDLAQMWAQAMDNRNRVAYARHVDALKARRSEITRIGDWLTGGFHYPPEPAPVAVPQPPGFAPTAAPTPWSSPAAVPAATG